MRKTITLLILLAASSVHATTYCNPERSKPCGKGCIPKDRACHKSWTTSLVGERPSAGSGLTYEHPTYVKEAPISQGTKGK